MRWDDPFRNITRDIERTMGIWHEMEKARGLSQPLSAVVEAARESRALYAQSSMIEDMVRKAAATDRAYESVKGLAAQAAEAISRTVSRLVAPDVEAAGRAYEALNRMAVQDAEGIGRVRENLNNIVNQLVEASRYRLDFGIDRTHLRAIGVLTPPLHHWAYDGIATNEFMKSLDSARELFTGQLGFAWQVRENFNAFLQDLYAPPVGREGLWDTSTWIEEELERLLASNPKYQESKLSWLLAIFVPRFRLALYKQDQAGDFDGVMEQLWEELLQDPEIRAKLRERLLNSVVREELRRSLARHLDKVEQGPEELEYAILALYAHIEGFLAEVALERKLIPSLETIVAHDGREKRRSGASDLVEILYREGQICVSQKRFLMHVMTNDYKAHSVRHGALHDFSHARATALVLALVAVLCLAWRMDVPSLLASDNMEDKHEN